MFPNKKSSLLRRSEALLVNTPALLLAYLLEPRFPYSLLVLFTVAVIVSAWYGGRLAGLLAVALATWCTGFFVLSLQNLTGSSREDYVRLCAFAALSLLVSGVNGARSTQRRAEQRQREAERHRGWLESVLNLQPTPLLLVSPEDGAVLLANRAAREMSGGRFPLVGILSGPTFCSDADGPVAPEAMPAARAARGEVLEGYRMEWSTPDGTRSLLVNAQLLPAAHGHPPAVALSFQDVTELQQAEEALRQSEIRYRTLAEWAPVGIFHTDAGGRIRYVNDRWRQITGAAPESSPDAAWMADVHPEDREQVERAWRTKTGEGRVFGLEYRLRRASGEEVWVWGQAAPLRGPDGLPVGCIGTLTDITEQKRAEAALRRLSEQRAALVATASHALRAPITAMLVNLEVLCDGTLGPLEQEQQEYVRRAVESAAELGRTVDHLLALARLQDGRARVQVQPADLEHTLTETYRQMLARAHARRVRLELELDPRLGPIRTDVRQLGCIVTELLENAIKYSPPGGRVALTARKNRGGVRIRVADEGPGIAPEELGQIFEPFFRGAAALRDQVPGTGLGLQIVKQTARLLGAELRVQSSAGSGTVFELALSGGRSQCVSPHTVGGRFLAV